MARILHLFEGYGIELEYMIVDLTTLNVKPLADALIKHVEGVVVSEINNGTMSWCNELVTHVIEIKTSNPEKTILGLEAEFQHNVQKINGILAPMGATLMPTAMHPWMNPFTETRIWEHEYNAIYEAFDSIFDCRGHGWANLQSTHLNLPFNGDEEFGKLHAAIRAVLPIMPALSASSPVMDGQLTGTLDNRLKVYRSNARRVPSVSGKVIPEAYFNEKEYREKLLQPIYDDIAEHDPEGILQDEWLNARGAIARFDRNAIEIRVLDIQECPAADLALLKLIVATIKALVASRWVKIKSLESLDIDALNQILMEITENGGNAEVSKEYASCFGLNTSVTVTQLWQHIYDALSAETFEKDDESGKIAQFIITEGNLSQRITKRLSGKPSKTQLLSVYRELIGCLAAGKMFK